MKSTIAILLFILFCNSAQSQGQYSIRNNKKLDSLVMSISDPIYNLDFNEAERRIDILNEHIPDHPIIDLLHALNIMWATMPDPEPPNFEQIESHLYRSIENAKGMLQLNKDDPEAIFFQLMAHSLLAQYYNMQGGAFKALGQARKAYKGVVSGLTRQDDYVEFYFSSGLYNYYREKYPELYPVYKSFVWVFRRGDMEKGLDQLHYSVQNTILSRVEATHYLAFIYLRYEEMPQKAFDILDPLVTTYPPNLYFKILLLESLLMLNELDKGTGAIKDLTSSENWYYKMNGLVFSGILEEKQNGNYTKARSDYLNAIHLGESHKDQALVARSLAYLGMGRISEMADNFEEAKKYYKKASKVAQTSSVKDESDAYLKNH